MLTLAQVEREVAGRAGPFYRLGAASGDATHVVVSALQSTIDIGGIEDMWLLRRGVTTAGAAIVGFSAGDRQRRIKDIDVPSGSMLVDRAYATAVVAGEEVELLALDPEQELRRCVVRGLWRCYFEDRQSAVLATLSAERDLTALFPWLTQEWQVVEFSTKDAAVVEIAPTPLTYSRPYAAGGGVSTVLTPDPSPYTVYVTALRPVASYVNALTSATGPTADADVLVGDQRFLDYLAAAGHAALWKYLPFKMQPLAAARMGLTRDEVAAQFASEASIYVPEGRTRVQYREPFRVSSFQGDAASWD
jgi:hypothetical protein